MERIRSSKKEIECHEEGNVATFIHLASQQPKFGRGNVSGLDVHTHFREPLSITQIV